MVKQGQNVYKITLTDTEVYSEDMNIAISADRAKQNSIQACKCLGVKEIEYTTETYGNLIYSQENMQRLEHIIGIYNIDTVFFHFADDYQTDHLAAHQICKTATRHCRNVFMFQSNPYILVHNFTPNFFIDISNSIKDKERALACYDSEHNRQGRLFESIIQRNAIWGYGNHCAYAEGFICVKYCL